jgi:hypothetical protein
MEKVDLKTGLSVHGEGGFKNLIHLHIQITQFFNPPSPYTDYPGFKSRYYQTMKFSVKGTSNL